MLRLHMDRLFGMDPFEKTSEQGGLLSFGNTKSQLGLSQKSRQGERGPGRKIKGFTYSWVKDYHNNSKFPWNWWLERRGGNSQHEVTGGGALTDCSRSGFTGDNRLDTSRGSANRLKAAARGQPQCDQPHFLFAHPPMPVPGTCPPPPALLSL